MKFKVMLVLALIVLRRRLTANEGHKIPDEPYQFYTPKKPCN